MPLFTVYHHDNEAALFSSECTAGALNTTLMDLAAGYSSTGAALQPLAALPNSPSSGGGGMGNSPTAEGAPKRDSKENLPPSVALPPGEGAPAPPPSRGSSAKSKRHNITAALAVSLLESPTMNLAVHGGGSGDFTGGGGWLSNTAGGSSSSSLSPSSHHHRDSGGASNSSGNFGASLSHSPLLPPFPVYNYHKLELLPLSYVLELVNNPKVLSALQTAQQQQQQALQQQLAEGNNSPSQSSGKGKEFQPGFSGTLGPSPSVTSVTLGGAAATTAAATNSASNNPSLSALLHNIPFVGLMTTPVHNSIQEMCPPNGSFILLGCRERATKASKNRRVCGRNPGETPPLSSDVTPPTTGAGGRSSPTGVPITRGRPPQPPQQQQAPLALPTAPGGLPPEEDAELGVGTVFRPEAQQGDVSEERAGLDALRAAGLAVYVVENCGGHRFRDGRGGKKGKAAAKSSSLASRPAGATSSAAPSFAAPTRRPPTVHSVPTAPPPPQASDVMDLVQKAKSMASRTFHRSPFAALGVPTTTEISPSATPGTPGMKDGKEKKGDKGHGRHGSSSGDDNAAHFGPRRLLTTALPPLPPPTVSSTTNAGDDQHLDDPTTPDVDATTLSTTLPPEKTGGAAGGKGSGRGKGKGGKEKSNSPGGKNAASSAAAAAAAAKDENAPIIEEHTEIPLSGAASALLYNCPHSINISMSSGAINVRSVPAAQEESIAMMLACGVDDAVGGGGHSLSPGSPSKGGGGASASSGNNSINGGPAGPGAKTHILERMEAFDVLWRGTSGEHEVLSWLLQEYLKTMKAKIAAAYVQAAGGGSGGATVADKKGKKGKKK